MRKFDAQYFQKGLDVAGPPVGNCCCGGDINPNQCPAGQEGNKLTDGNPGVEESTAGVREAGGQLGVAESDQATGQGGNEK